MNAFAEPAARGGGDYPVHLEIPYQEEYPRWLPLVAWLLALPHYFVLFVLGIGAWFALIGAFFAILFTGSYPEGIFNYLVGLHRYSTRVGAYLFWMTSEYPPFSLEPGGHPVTYSVDYPTGGISRWRPLVHWLLVIPFAIAAAIVLWVAYILLIVPFFTIIFTKRFTRGIFDIVLIALRWQARENAYLYWMTERYPPFAWD